MMVFGHVWAPIAGLYQSFNFVRCFLAYHIKKTNSIKLKKIFKRITVKKNNHKLIVCSKVSKIFINNYKVYVWCAVSLTDFTNNSKSFNIIFSLPLSLIPFFFKWIVNSVHFIPMKIVTCCHPNSWMHCTWWCQNRQFGSLAQSEALHDFIGPAR